MVRGLLRPTASAAAIAVCRLVSGPVLAAEKASSALTGAVRQDGLPPVQVGKAKGPILLSLPAADDHGVFTH